MKHAELDLAALDRFQKSDVAQRPERRRQQPRPHVDQRHLGIRQRIENLHLVRDLSHVHDLR